MAPDPFGNDRPKPPASAGGRALRLAGAGEVAIGLALLIAGFATSSTVLIVVGIAAAASSGTLFVIARTIDRRGG